jgi:glycosyltransferase involved in cell wall biosynthesis
MTTDDNLILLTMSFTTIEAPVTALVCFSHLRWNFVYQRPQHLFVRFAKVFKVFYVEEPKFDANNDFIVEELADHNVRVITPHMYGTPDAEDVRQRQRALMDHLFSIDAIERYIFWYYTPLALAVTDHFKPELIIYDCMDELSAFDFASPELKQYEQILFDKADIVFTGGYSLFEAKRSKHNNIHCYPSSIDKDHFVKARYISSAPADQQAIPHPRIGYCGVIDERLDVDLFSAVAQLRSDWHFILVGPVVKIDPQRLPRFANIHYLGQKRYDELPCYIAGWDVAMMPFALNKATQFISPTKTPEYLAAGKPVISTPIKDVVRPYGINGLVQIAHTPEEFVSMAECALQLDDEARAEWLRRVDAFLDGQSWDLTWKSMMNDIRAIEEVRPGSISPLKQASHV